MWRAYLIKFCLKIRFNNDLLERLRGNPKLREVCGFGSEVPSESAFSRFISRLADHQPLVHQCLVGLTNKLRKALPSLGKVVAIDSTLFPSYSNPNRRHVSDPDARWGLKHSARAKVGGEEFGWGYKMHLLSDTTHGLPLDFIITPVIQGDSPMLPSVVQQAQQTYPWLRPQFLLADKGYDSQANHAFLVKKGVTPVIHLRKGHNGALHGGIYTADGAPTCLGQVGMEYHGTDRNTGHHLFRCPKGGCHLRAKSNWNVRYCDSEVWEDPTNNLRVIGVLPRSSKLWKILYAQRMSIERVFRSLKHSRGLELHCARGMRRILLHATMSVLTYQATALARVRAGDPRMMRTMWVEVD